MCNRLIDGEYKETALSVPSGGYYQTEYYDVSEGEHSAQILWYDDDDGSEHVHTTSIYIGSGNYVNAWLDLYEVLPTPQIELTPPSHDFGEVRTDVCTPPYWFTLKNIGGGTATGSVYLTGSNPSQFIITSGDGSFSLNAGEIKTIGVAFGPTSTGAKSANLFANGSNCNNDSSSLSGTGVEATYPPQVTTEGASIITATSATLTGNLDSTGGETCQVWFEYGTTTSYGSSPTPLSMSSTGVFCAIISPLNPDTTYHFRAVAENSKGKAHGSDMTFKTEKETHPPTVTTNAATNEEETTATLNGVVSSDGGEACQYRFEYDTNQGEPYAYNTGWTGNKTTGQSFSHAIYSLDKGIKYYFRAQAKNSAGIGSGSELTFLTKPDAPTSFSAISAGATQIELSWAKGSGAQNTKILRKQGSYPTNRDDGTEVYFGTGTTKSDTGLAPGTTYYYCAWSYVQGSEQWSDNHAQASATTTSIICSVHLESSQDNAATTNKGTITFNGSDYSLPHDISVSPKSYTATYNPESDYEFVRWETSGNITVSDLDSPTTTVTVSCGGTLRAIYRVINVVTFPDPNLEAAIREAINKPTGDIYQSDLEGLTSFGAHGRGISDLTGMEYCINLTRLYLCDNQIIDLSPLANLTNLTRLYLSDNQI